MAPMLHTFTIPGHYYVFDVNANSIIPLDEKQYGLAREIEAGQISEEAQVMIRDFQQRNYFKEPNIQKIEHPETSAMSSYLMRKIQKLTLQVTQRCNLRCDYCVYSGLYKTRTHAPKSMSFETAKKAIDLVFERSIDSEALNFGFYGGEPLLELDLIKECAAYIKSRGIDKELSFNLTTNGTLLTPEIFAELTSIGISIAVSLDGPKDVHDKSRKYANGGGTFDDIMKNMAAIQAIYPEAKDKLNFLAVAAPTLDDSCLEKLYKMEDILPSYGVSLSFLSDTYTDNQPVYSDGFYAASTQESAKMFLYMLGRLDKNKVSRLLLNSEGQYKKKHKELKRIYQIPKSCHPGGPCLAGVMRLFTNVDGAFYPCERVSEKSVPMRIGDVDSGIDIDKAIALVNVGKTTENQCKKCWAILHCTMCAAHADDLTTLSGGSRLKRCATTRNNVENNFKDVCFLKEMGYDFEAE